MHFCACIAESLRRDQRREKRERGGEKEVETKNGNRSTRATFLPFFQREEAGETGRAAAGAIVGREVAESGVERTIDGSGGLQGT